MRVFGALVLLLASAVVYPTQAQDCDRSCLAGFLDSYLNALAANDASLAPLSHGFRQTENSIVTPYDEGLWSTVTALGELQRRYYDPAVKTAGYFGLLGESGAPAVVALLLKVENRMITEAE